MVDPEFFIIKNFLDDYTCKSLIKILDNKITDGEASEAGVLSGVSSIKNKTQRDTDLLFLSPDSMLGTIFFYAAKTINCDLKWNFDIDQTESIQLLRYNIGGFYVPHIDVLPTYVRGKQRKVSIGVSLNDPAEYIGGEFRIYPTSQKDHIDFRLPKGDAIAFPSFLCHEVRPVLNGVRYSSTAWIEGPNWR